MEIMLLYAIILKETTGMIGLLSDRIREGRLKMGISTLDESAIASIIDAVVSLVSAATVYIMGKREMYVNVVVKERLKSIDERRLALKQLHYYTNSNVIELTVTHDEKKIYPEPFGGSKRFGIQNCGKLISRFRSVEGSWEIGRVGDRICKKRE